MDRRSIRVDRDATRVKLSLFSSGGDGGDGGGSGCALSLSLSLSVRDDVESVHCDAANLILSLSPFSFRGENRQEREETVRHM